MGSTGSFVAPGHQHSNLVGQENSNLVGQQSSNQQTAQRNGRRIPNVLFSAVRPSSMSQWSSAPVPNSAWADENFLLGAGMVVFQPATLKVVVIYEREKKYWFLPKGRKDVGESLEQAALREAYEESGYRVEFLPLYTNTSAPGPPDNLDAPFHPNCEPIFINTTSYPERKRRRYVQPPGEYLSFWYIGQIPADAVREEGTGMPDEINYETHLLNYREAVQNLQSGEARVVQYAAMLFDRTRRLQEEIRRRQLETTGSGSDPSSSESDPLASL